ncbi:hypothetical protein [Archangium sp.]|uniref:hypothetical protein n=1 Tax=Archangium sp. TaxID=1872627 RepID=UPI00286CFC17|nr:hypothetical protein [Archangium sp.]
MGGLGILGARQEVNQRIEIRPPPNLSGLNYAGYFSKSLYDLTSSFVTIEVVQVLNQVNGTDTLLTAGLTDDNRVELVANAGNIALFRSAAGVHWRSDYTDSLPLGEAVAIGLLQEMSLTFNEEDAFFQFTRFDGITVRISNGVVKPLL